MHPGDKLLQTIRDNIANCDKQLELLDHPDPEIKARYQRTTLLHKQGWVDTLETYEKIVEEERKKRKEKE